MPAVAQAERGGGHDAKGLVIQVCSIDDVDVTDQVDFVFLGGGVEVRATIARQEEKSDAFGTQSFLSTAFLPGLIAIFILVHIALIFTPPMAADHPG
jgi:hypothetical protein